MTYNKGDLVLISDEKRVYTCILLTDLYLTGAGTKFYFSHCVETGSNGMIYENEIVTLVSKGFDPHFEYESDIFDQHYWYEMMLDSFTYWPSFWASDPDDDSSEED
jgi:hypothetical protein